MKEKNSFESLVCFLVAIVLGVLFSMYAGYFIWKVAELVSLNFIFELGYVKLVVCLILISNIIGRRRKDGDITKMWKMLFDASILALISWPLMYLMIYLFIKLLA